VRRGGSFAHTAKRARSWPAIVTRAILIVDINLEAKKLMKASLARPGIASRAAAPSPARHSGCKKNRNRRAACPLPQPSGRGIFKKEAVALFCNIGRGIFRKTSSRKEYCPLMQPSGREIFRRRRLLYSATVGRGILGKTSSRDIYCPFLQLSGRGTFRMPPSRDT
jgi:hypothetical protein